MASMQDQQMPHQNSDLLDQANSYPNQSDRVINTLQLSGEISVGRTTNNVSSKIDDTQVGLLESPESNQRGTGGFKLIATLLFGMASVDLLILNVAALLPTYVEFNFPQVNSLQVGMLMACYPIAFLITSPFVGLFMEKLGRKNFVVFGMMLMTISTGTFGLAAYVGKNARSFFGVSFVARICQGIADGMITVTMPSIIVLEYPDKQELYLGYLNMSIGVGTCIGPILGSILYRFLSYSETFAVFTVLIGISVIVTAIMLPKRLNETRPTRTESQERNNPQNASYGQFFTNKFVLLLLLMEVSAIMFEYYVDPILGPQFVNLNVAVSNVGYGFATIGGSFGLGSLVAGRLCQVMHRNYVIQIGSLFQGLGILLLGPSNWLGFQPLIPVMYCGMFCVGFFAAFAFTAVIPGVIEEMELKAKERAEANGQQYVGGSEQISDKTSALFNVSYALGGAISPIIGGALYDAVGFQTTADYMSVTALSISLIFFLFFMLPFLLQKKQQE